LEPEESRRIRTACRHYIAIPGQEAAQQLCASRDSCRTHALKYFAVSARQYVAKQGSATPEWYIPRFGCKTSLSAIHGRRTLPAVVLDLKNEQVVGCAGQQAPAAKLTLAAVLDALTSNPAPTILLQRPRLRIPELQTPGAVPAHGDNPQAVSKRAALANGYGKVFCGFKLSSAM